MAKGNGSSGRQLVIVESPAKARTIGRYLGRRFDVVASVGHVRDLPKKDLGVDVEGDFEPKYVTIRGKGKVLKELKDKARKADSVILATDPDREGEAIAYHVAEQLGWEKEPGRFRRVEFREITKRAVERALEDPGELDLKKVEAQQARRILDRLVGYQVSPFLWKPIRPGLSAGRVQTVALRLICEREDEIRRFEPEEYWSITAHLEKEEEAFEARLQKIDGSSFTLPDETTTQAVLDAIDGVPFRTTSVKRRERRKNAPAPFTTSTLQQEAAKRLRYSARRTMSNAQRLYEGREVGSRGTVGLITYMRTDSTRVSAEAAAGAQSWVRKNFGDRYTPSSPRLWAGKQSKGAQEAHEAIRPTDPGLHPDEARRYLDQDEARLYELIWLRFVASQMSPTVYDTTTLDFDLAGSDGRTFTFRSTGSVVKFDGFTRVYREATEAGDHRRLDDLEPLPAVEEGEVVDQKAMEPKQHFTQPPPRFSEASLVKELEKLGIGRPSTYAQIISTILDRGYVEMEERRFVPTPLGDTVSKLLVRVFPNIFDVAFTSRMEGELDRVEEGEVGWRELLKEFYPPFQDRLEKGKSESDEIVKEILAAEGETCEKCGSSMLVKWNRFGRFLGCSAYPECKNTRSLDGPGELDEDTELGRDPDTGKSVWLKSGPYGPYVQLGEKEEGQKPPRASLPKDVKPEEADLELALKLLSLPRELGTDPESGQPVKAGLGRYGPYVNRAREYRNLASFQQIFEVTLEEALELLKQKQGPAVLKELGKHPETGRELQILDGRYGPYLTDGELNASLGKGEDPADMDLEAAVELLERSGKRPRGRRRGSTAKKGGATKKSTTAKKSTTTKKGAGKGTTGKAKAGTSAKGKGSRKTKGGSDG